MAKYVFCGDIHGKVEQVEKALAMDGMKVFVGDFMDSFDRTPEDHERCLQLVLQAIDNGETKALYGNHELSYLVPRHRCSGYSSSNHSTMNHYCEEIYKKFSPFLILGGDLLVTHAGLTKDIWVKNKMTLKNMDEKLMQWWSDPYSPAHYIGKYRGGYDPYGGIFWCDFNMEFKPIPKLTQIFGHSEKGGNVGIRNIENSYCIDCLSGPKAEFLTMEI